MKIKAYSIISRAVEEGVSYGITRLFKHSAPLMTEAGMRGNAEVIENEVLNALCEFIDFDDDEVVEVKDGVRRQSGETASVLDVPCRDSVKVST